jgi:hypothetical protein
MRKRRKEGGIALLISIFVLLLISVVAIALIVSSGTESALAGNYRSSTGVYYAALAGIEEARGRLSTKNPNSFNSTDPGFLPSPGTTIAIGYVGYILNPGPTDPADTRTAYPDGEYDTEFGTNALAATTPKTTPSVWNRSPLNSLNVPGPLYKWVRINPVSEKSLQLDVGPAYDGFKDPVTPVFYDGAQLNVVGAGAQVIEITALAVLPNGSQKIVQYLAAPTPVSLPPLPAALTLAGSLTTSVVSYTAPPTNNGFVVDGRDHDCGGNLLAGGPKYPSIGVFTSADAGPTGPVLSGIPNGFIRNNDYPGIYGSPDVEVIYLTFTPTQRKPSGLDAIMQSITQNADVIITPSSGPALGSDLTAATPGMSSANPMTVVINGDLDLLGWHNTGYGLLLVTGNLNYDPDASWEGVILVVGQGTITGSKGGSGHFYGAFLVARTRDASGNLILPDTSFGTSSVNFNYVPSNPMGGIGIRYSSCWINKSQPSSGFKILSFHEISQ